MKRNFKIELESYACCVNMLDQYMRIWIALSVLCGHESVVAHGTCMGTDTLRNQDFFTGLRLKLPFCRYINLSMMVGLEVTWRYAWMLQALFSLVHYDYFCWITVLINVMFIYFMGNGECIFFDKWPNHLESNVQILYNQRE